MKSMLSFEPVSLFVKQIAKQSKHKDSDFVEERLTEVSKVLTADKTKHSNQFISLDRSETHT